MTTGARSKAVRPQPPQGEASAVSRIRFAGSANVLACLHLLATQYFLPWSVVFGPDPILGEDFALHFGQVSRVLEGLNGWGRSWVYDVSLLAGQPAGTILDAGNKGWELWTYGLTRLGLPKALAFNSFVLCVMWAGPVVVYASGRLFRLSRASSLLAAALASALWFFDSFFHWSWWVGMVSFAGAAYLSLLTFALFVRLLETKRSLRVMLCGLSLGATLLVHPYSFFALTPPMLVVSFRYRSMWRALLAAAVIAVAMNAYWLHNAWTHWHYILNSAYYGQGHPEYLIFDFAQLLRDPMDTGMIGVRTGFRFLTLLLGCAGILLFQGRGDDRWKGFAAAVFSLLAIAYLGGEIVGLSQLQPYRFVLPALFFAVIPAGAFIEAFWRERGAAAFSGRAMRVVMGLSILQHLTAQVVYFVPSAVPTVRSEDGPSPISAYGHLMGQRLGDWYYGFPYPGLDAELDRVVRWVRGNVPKGSRVLVEFGPLGERLATQAEVEVLGGFFERNLAHAYANYFRRFEHRPASKADLKRYLRLFAVRWVLPHRRHPELAQASDVLEPHPLGRAVFAYRVRDPGAHFVRGDGRLSARTNRIEVRATAPSEDVVLSYHFHEALACVPDCRVERFETDLDAVGLIRVPAPHPPDFTLFNSYRLRAQE